MFIVGLVDYFVCVDFLVDFLVLCFFVYCFYSGRDIFDQLELLIVLFIQYNLRVVLIVVNQGWIVIILIDEIWFY